MMAVWAAIAGDDEVASSHGPPEPGRRLSDIHPVDSGTLARPLPDVPVDHGGRQSSGRGDPALGQDAAGDKLFLGELADRLQHPVAGGRLLLGGTSDCGPATPTRPTRRWSIVASPHTPATAASRTAGEHPQRHNTLRSSSWSKSYDHPPPGATSDGDPTRAAGPIPTWNGPSTFNTSVGVIDTFGRGQLDRQRVHPGAGRSPLSRLHRRHRAVEGGDHRLRSTNNATAADPARPRHRAAGPTRGARRQLESPRE